MKYVKVTAMFLALCMAFAFAACSKKQADGNTTPAVPSQEPLSGAEVEPDVKFLAAYFPYDESSVKAAELISKQTGAKLFALETENGYSEKADERAARAKDEKTQNVRPSLKNKLDSISPYSVVFICTPLWEDDLPMAFYTFFEDYDMRDRIILPICSSADKDAAEKCEVLVKGALGDTAVTLGGFLVSPGAEPDEDAMKAYIQQSLYE